MSEQTRLIEFDHFGHALSTAGHKLSEFAYLLGFVSQRIVSYEDELTLLKIVDHLGFLPSQAELLKKFIYHEVDKRADPSLAFAYVVGNKKKIADENFEIFKRYYKK